MRLLDLPLAIWQDIIMPNLGLRDINALRLACKATHTVKTAFQHSNSSRAPTLNLPRSDRSIALLNTLLKYRCL